MTTDPACIFCKIASGQIPSTQVFRDEISIAFHDIHPAAPVHVLVIPIRHVTFVAGLKHEDEPLLGHLLRVGATVARQKGIDASGYRLLVNQGPNAGQQVDHLHVHVLGGRRLGAMA
jgi:histidine triad (HIT) family protein